MNETMWGIHAGALGEVDHIFMSKTSPCVAVGWEEMGDLSALPADREAFKQKVIKTYPDIKKGAIPNYTGVLFRFVHEMKTGDYIVYPSKQDRHVNIGKVTGNYQYAPQLSKYYPNVRSVQWLATLPRTDFSQGALYEIGASLSLFQVKNYMDEMLAKLTMQVGGKLPESTGTTIEDDVTVGMVAESIEETTQDFLFKKLSKGLKGFPFEGFVAHLLEVLGYKTRLSKQGGDGGIDIIAHKDALGIEPPIIKVQVKSVDGKITPSMVQALYGTIENSEYGLFVTLGSFTKQAEDFAKSKPNLRLINGEELIKLILEHYEDFDSKYKAMIPMKKVYIPIQVDEG